MSTSNLQKTVGKRITALSSKLKIFENIRPEWLISSHGEHLELDFLLDDLSIAIEVQGEQHYVYVPFFHVTWQGFLDQKRRDEEKAQICSDIGIRLLYVADEVDLERVLLEIRREIEKLQEYIIPEQSSKLVDNYVQPSVFKKYKTTVLRLRKKLLSIQREERNLFECSIQGSIKKRIRRICHIEKMCNIKRGGFADAIISLGASLTLTNEQVEAYWKNRKELRRSGQNNTGPFILGPLPGSHSSRRNARIRNVKRFQDGLNLVSGGESQHVVWFFDEKNFACACNGWENAKDKVCCHVYAVMINIGLYE